MGSLDTECLIGDDISKACTEYGDKLDSLYRLLQESKPKLDMMKSLATEMKAIKLTVKQSTPAPDSPALQSALKEAKQAEAEFGKGSKEAAVAWDAVEEIASTGLGNSMGPRLDEECLVETAMEACQALDELNRALNSQKTGAGTKS
jgi:CP12 domain